jgi:hypothetical protein
MWEASGPCPTGWSPAEIIASVGIAVNLCLLTWLARRRVQKDRKDNHRWSTCPLLDGGPLVAGHKHTLRRASEVQRWPN